MENDRKLEVVEDFEKYTKYEVARVIGTRALQIALGSPIFLEEKDLRDKSFIEIAEMEFKNKSMPLTIVRVYPERRTKW
jgi:DNA-directed RNA polymerase subunit K/omega